MANISVSLPSDGTTADVADYNTPITTIVNEINGNLDNSNIASGAAIATSKLADDAGIGGAKLSPSAIKLGFASTTSNFTSSATSATLVTGLSSTVTVPAGGRSVKVTAYIPEAGATSGAATATISIWDGTVGSGTQIGAGRHTSSAAGDRDAMTVQAVVTPSSGSKTYNVGFATDVGTFQLTHSATQPGFILVEAI